MDVEHIVGDVEDHKLREELRSCQHFLVDTELERARHKVFKYAVETLNETIVNEKLDHLFNNSKFAAKVNLVFGFILKEIEYGGFSYFYAHENITLLDRSKFMCTQDHSTKLNKFFDKTDVIESCSRERRNTKWRFYKLTNLTNFAAWLKDLPMGCKNAVFPEPLVKNHTINCLTFEENTRQAYNDNLCFFRAVALHMHGNQRLEEETSKLFNLFMNKLDGLRPNQFQGVHMNDIPTVEDLLTLNILLYDIDIVDANIVGELARRSVQKYENTVQLLRHNNHICYVNNIDAVFQSFRCPNCDTFSTKLSICSDIWLHAVNEWKKFIGGTYIKSAKLSLTNWTLSVSSTLMNKKLFKKLAISHFESNCVQEETFRDANTITWIGNLVPISVSISLNLGEEPIFLCNFDSHHLVASFIGALENLALQSRAIMENLFFDIETTINIKLGSILEKLTQRHNRREQDHLDDCDNETCTSTQFLQIQKKQLLDLQEHLERYCSVLPIFGFNSAKYDLNLIKSYLLPILVNERNIEPTVIKKRTSLSRSKSAIFSCWILWIFLEVQQVLIPSWRHTKHQRQRDSSPTNGLITPTKCKTQNFPRMMLSTVNFPAATLSKPNTQIMLTYWKVDWPQNKPLWNWSCQSHPLLELRIIITCNRYGSKNKWAHSGTFCGGITTKMLCQLWRQCKKWLPFTTTKIWISWSLDVHYQTWLTFAHTNPPMQILSLHRGR